MPNPLRSFLLAFVLAVIALGCATTVSGAVTDQPPREGKRVTIAWPKPPHYPARRKPRKRTIGERAARIALKAVGVPYRWGGSSPASGFDCSGLVYWAYKRLGVELPHSSYALYGKGRRVARRRMRPGDLLFFSGLGHVGLYVGRGRMVHAPHSGRVVEVVRLSRSGYGGRLVGARRIS